MQGRRGITSESASVTKARFTSLFVTFPTIFALPLTKPILPWPDTILSSWKSHLCKANVKKKVFWFLKFNYPHWKAVTKEVVLVYVNEAPLHCITGGYKEIGPSPGLPKFSFGKSDCSTDVRSTPSTATCFCKARSLWLMAIYQNKALTSTDKCTAGRHVASSISQFEETGEKRRLLDRFESTEQTRVARKVRKHCDLNSTQTTGHPTFILQ